MSNRPVVSRRSFVATGIALGAGAVSTPCAADETIGGESSRSTAGPLAQDFTVIYKKPNVAGLMVDTPCVVRLPGGRLLASHNVDGSWGGGIGQTGLDKVFPGGRNYFVHASDDNGQSWLTFHSVRDFRRLALNLYPEA